MTRATGRNNPYRYYTCWNLARYDASKCDSAGSTPTPSSTNRNSTRPHADGHAELAAIDNDLTKTGQVIDRYLTTFERGTMDDELVADRLTELRAKTKHSASAATNSPSPSTTTHHTRARHPGGGGRLHRRDHHQRHP